MSLKTKMAEALTVDSEYLLKFPHFQEQEKDYVKYLMGTLANKGHSHNHAQSSSLVQEIEKAREQLKNSLNNVGHRGERKHSQSAENARIKKLEESLHAVLARVAELEAQVRSLTLQGQKPGSSVPAPVAAAPAKPEAKEAAGDDDFDMFGSDNEEDLEAERIRQERVKEYAAKKSTKPTLIAKSNIILDVKPWDDETDLAEVEKKVRSIQCDGLLWGSAKLVPLAYGIKKLQISCVVEDDKVGTDFLEEEITKFEDLVQSVDVAAFNKI